mgnify:CR=1 FL=1
MTHSFCFEYRLLLVQVDPKDRTIEMLKWMANELEREDVGHTGNVEMDVKNNGIHWLARKIRKRLEAEDPEMRKRVEAWNKKNGKNL